jgi:hypothetical protein
VNTDDARSVGLVGGNDAAQLLGPVDQVLVDAAGTAAGVSRAPRPAGPPGITSYSLESRSAISGTTASSVKWIDSTEFVE